MLVPPEEVERLLSFSAATGPLVGHWQRDDQLSLRMAPGARKPPADPLMQHLVASVRRVGGVVVAPPALSLPAVGSSPPLRVPHCFLEGFEAATLSSRETSPSWVIESLDASAYTVVFDHSVTRSGKYSLRLTGGRHVNFDGIAAQLPPGSKPQRVSFWVRSSTAADVGYFTLGGHTIASSVLFFHLRADGSAGLLSSSGTWESGPYTLNQWLHVAIDIDWAYQRADLSLDGELIASDVAFASSEAKHADEIHLFSFDEGTVWWDDILIRL